MAWNYNAVEIYAPEVRGVESSLPIGLKITKTYVDDSGTELFTADSTVEEAKAEAEEGFILEYAEAARQVFSNQIAYLLNYSNGQRDLVASSDANLIGFQLRSAVEALNILAGLYE